MFDSSDRQVAPLHEERIQRSEMMCLEQALDKPISHSERKKEKGSIHVRNNDGSRQF
jgi:hypothetical protein